MNDEWQWWALLLGICLGVGGYWLVRERLPRREDDVDTVERASEAAWISRTVERMGAEAPPEVVSTVLELHREYLAERAPAPGWMRDPGAPASADGAGPEDLAEAPDWVEPEPLNPIEPVEPARPVEPVEPVERVEAPWSEPRDAPWRASGGTPSTRPTPARPGRPRADAPPVDPA